MQLTGYLLVLLAGAATVIAALRQGQNPLGQVRADESEMKYTLLIRQGKLARGLGRVPFMDIIDGNITVETVRQLTPLFFTILSDDLLSRMASSFDDEQQRVLCRSLTRSSGEKLLKRLNEGGIDCLDFVGKDPTVRVGEGTSFALLESLRERGSQERWGAEQWKTALRISTALKPRDLKQMNTTVIREMVRDKSVDRDSFEGNPSNQRAFNERLKSAYGSPQSWNKTDMEEIGGDLIANLNVKDIDKLDASAVAQILSTFKNTSFRDPMRKAAFGRKVISGLGGLGIAWAWSADQIENTAQFSMRNPELLAGLSRQKLANTMSAFKEHVKNKRDALALALLLKKLSRFSTPSTLTDSDLRELGNTLAGCLQTFIDDLEGNALSGAMSELKTGDFQRGQARSMMKTMKNNGDLDPASLTGDDIARTGNLTAGLDKDDFERIPARECKNATRELGKVDLGIDQARVVVKKIKESLGGDFSSSNGESFEAKDMGKLFKHVTKDEIRDLVDNQHLDLSCESETAFDIEVDRDQAMVIMEKFKEVNGVPDPSNTNYSSACFEKLGKIGALGLGKKDIEDMREDDELLGILEKLKPFEDEMEEYQTKAIAMKIKKVFLENSTRLMEVDDAVATQFAVFLKHFDDSALEMFNVSVRPTICRMLGLKDVTRIPKAGMRRLKRFCLRNIMRDDTEMVTDRTDAPSRDDNDIRDLGSLMCGLETSDMEKLTSEAISYNLPTLGKCPFGADEAKALLDRAIELDAQFLDSSETLAVAGKMLDHLSDSQRQSISDEALSEAFLDMADTFGELDKTQSKRDEAFSAELESSHRTRDSQNRAALMKEGLVATQGSGLRDRRALRTLTCNEVQSLGNTAATTMNARDISDMETAEFTACLETLGSIGDWDIMQLEALGIAAKSALGAVDTWSPEEIRRAGSIVAGLHVRELSDLRLNSTAAMTSIGRYDLYNADKREVIFERWLNLTQDGRVMDIDADELMALGQFACGIPAFRISDIRSPAYRDAASHVGRLTSCDDAQFASYASIAKRQDTFGSDVTTWESSTINSIGSVIGGLSSGELGSLSEDQVAVITPATMSSIPPTRFAGFTHVQMRSFTGTQAGAVSQQQRAQLSAQQRQVLGSIADQAIGVSNDTDVTMDPAGPGGGGIDVTLPSVDRTDDPRQPDGDRPTRGDSGTDVTDVPIRQSELEIASEAYIRMVRSDILPIPLLEITLTEILAGNITERQIRYLLPAFFRILNDRMLRQLANSFNNRQQDVLCISLGERADAKLFDRLTKVGINCLRALASSPGSEIGESASHGLLESLREQEAPEDWGKNSWEAALSIPQALRPDDVNSINTTIVRDLVRDGSISSDAFVDNPSSQHAFNERLKTTYGSVDSWGAAEVRELGGLVANLQTDDIKNIDKDAIRSNLDQFSNATFPDAMRKAAFASRVVDSLGGVESASTWSSSEIEDSAQYTLKNREALSRMRDNKLRGAVSSFKEHVEDKKDALNVARRLRQLSDFSNPTEVDSSELSELGETLSGFPTSFVGNLSADAIAGAIPDLKEADFSRGQAKAMMETLQQSGRYTVDNLTAEEIAEAGNFMTGFNSSALSRIPAQSFNESLSTMAQLDFGADQARIVLKKLKESMGGDFSASDKSFPAGDLGNLFKYVNRGDLSDIVEGGHLNLDCNSGAQLDFEVDRDQAIMIMERVKQEKGPLIPSNTNFTSTCFETWGRCGTMGLDAKDLEGLPEDEDLPNVLEKMKDHECDMEDAQVQAVSEKIKIAYLANSTRLQEVDTAVAAQIAPFLKNLNEDELNQFNESVRPEICRGLGKSCLHRLPVSNIKRLKRFCLKNIVSDDGVTITDRTDAGRRKDNDIRDLGSLICGLEVSDIEKLTQDAITNNLPSLGKCPFGAEEAQALMDRAVQVDDQFLNKTETVVAAGRLLEYASDSQINSISQDILSESLIDIAETFDELDAARKRRDEAFSVEYNSTQRDTDRGRRVQLFQNGLQALTDTTQRKRRSLRFTRDTSSVTCTDVQSLGGSITALSASDITGMGTVEFTDCLETFGAVSDWDTVQLIALATAAKDALGQPDTWTSEEVRQAGSIVAGLTTSEIATLALDSIDVMSSIGQHGLYTSNQRMNGYSRWLSLTQSDSIDNVDSDELAALGHFACGIPTDHISQISPSVYVDAASAIGALDSCEESQLAAFAALAKDNSAFGSDVTTWSSSEVAAAGAVVGGLTKVDISRLSDDQISLLTPVTISQIPPSVFSGFSVTQLGYFTTSQANAVTETQQMALTDEQVDALVEAGGINLVTDDGGDSSGTVIAPAVTLMVVGMTAVFL